MASLDAVAPSDCEAVTQAVPFSRELGNAKDYFRIKDIRARLAEKDCSYSEKAELHMELHDIYLGKSVDQTGAEPSVRPGSDSRTFYDLAPAPVHPFSCLPCCPWRRECRVTPTM